VEANCHFLEFPALPTDSQSLVGELSLRTASNADLAAPATERLQKNFAVGSFPVSIHATPLAVRHRTGNQTAGGKQSTYRKTSTDVLFSLGNCGTFMPLSRVRGESRIAVVWTWLVAAVSAISSGHFSALFTHEIFLSAADCR